MLPTRIPTLTLLKALGLAVLSCVVAAVLAIAIMSQVACRRPAPVIQNRADCAPAERPAVHCPGLKLLVYRECQWGCE